MALEFKKEIKTLNEIKNNLNKKITSYSIPQDEMYGDQLLYHPSLKLIKDSKMLKVDKDEK